MCAELLGTMVSLAPLALPMPRHTPPCPAAPSWPPSAPGSLFLCSGTAAHGEGRGVWPAHRPLAKLPVQARGRVGLQASVL